MRAHLEYRFERLGVDVYFFEEHGGGRTYYALAPSFDDTLALVPRDDVPPGELPTEPTLHLHVDALEALVQAAKPTLKVDDLAVEAITDARATRDRLLTLVERLTAST